MHEKKMALLVPTFRFNHEVMANLHYLASCADANIDVHIADNSEKSEKHIALQMLQSQQEGVYLHLHEKNIGGLSNFLYLIQQTKKYSYTCFASDDDKSTYSYFRGGLELLENNPTASCASGKLLMLFSDGQITSDPNHASANTAIERMEQYFNPQSFNLSIYSVMRGACLDPWLKHCQAHPLIAAFFDFFCSISAICQGQFVRHNEGYFLYSPDNWSDPETNFSSRRKHYENAGISPNFAYFQDLHFAIEGLVFLLGKNSPVSDSSERLECASIIWRKCFFNWHACAKQNFENYLNLVSHNTAATEALHYFLSNHDFVTQEAIHRFIHLIGAFSSEKADQYSAYVQATFSAT